MINLDTYCSHAFVSYDNRMQSICCRAQKHSPVTSYSHSFEHAEIQQMRQDLLQGVKHPICRVCWQDESVGLVSTRQDSIKGKSIQQLEQEVESPKLKWLWIDPGNYCNLACRTCFPSFSTSLGVEWAKKYNSKQQVIVKKPNLEVIAREDLSQIQTVMILGGEPFIDQEHFKVLDSIIEQKHQVDFQIIYVTNNTRPIPDRVIDYIEKFPDLNVIVTLSLDAVEKQFEYIRTRGHWQEFSQNFDRLDAIRKQNKNLSLCANITIGLLNCLYLEPLYDWIHRNHLSNTTVSFVEGAEHYQFKVLDFDQRQQVIEHLGRSRFDLDFVIRSIQTSSYDPALVDRFWQEIDWTHNHLGLDIKEYLPDLALLLTSG